MQKYRMNQRSLSLYATKAKVISFFVLMLQSPDHFSPMTQQSLWAKDSTLSRLHEHIQTQHTR